MSTGFLGATLGLSVAGIDPAAALIAVASVLGGARVRHVWIFLGVVLVGAPAGVSTNLAWARGRSAGCAA